MSSLDKSAYGSFASRLPVFTSHSSKRGSIYKQILIENQDQIVDCLGGLDNIIGLCLSNPNANNIIDKKHFEILKNILQPFINDDLNNDNDNDNDNNNTDTDIASANGNGNVIDQLQSISQLKIQPQSCHHHHNHSHRCVSVPLYNNWHKCNIKIAIKNANS